MKGFLEFLIGILIGAALLAFAGCETVLATKYLL